MSTLSPMSPSSPGFRKKEDADAPRSPSNLLNSTGSAAAADNHSAADSADAGGRVIREYNPKGFYARVFLRGLLKKAKDSNRLDAYFQTGEYCHEYGIAEVNEFCAQINASQMPTRVLEPRASPLPLSARTSGLESQHGLRPPPLLRRDALSNLTLAGLNLQNQ